ncbi:hypothetical protein P8452_60037 [Trifolium repens]|nr:hypothetical protein P8452_60037 [Trifolium repens]
MKFESSSKTLPTSILMKSKSMFQKSIYHVSQNQRLNVVSRNGSSNISDQFTAKINSLGLISNPALNNGEKNGRKRHHNG